MAKVSLQGLDELMKNLQQLGERASKVENEALRKGAELVQAEASSKAPRSEMNKPHLADNIVISKVKTGEIGKYIEVGPTKGDNSPFFYGKFLEWGTSKMAARPFMYPALIQAKDRAIAAMAEVIKGAIHK